MLRQIREIAAAVRRARNSWPRKLQRVVHGNAHARPRAVQENLVANEIRIRPREHRQAVLNLPPGPVFDGDLVRDGPDDLRHRRAELLLEEPHSLADG